MSTATKPHDKRFFVSATAEREKEVVTEHKTLTLTSRDWEAFLAVLDDADRRRPRLAAAARQYMSRRDRDAS